MPEQRPNHAWRNLWVPFLVALLVGVCRAVDLLTTEQALWAVGTLDFMFPIMAIGGFFIYASRPRTDTE